MYEWFDRLLFLVLAGGFTLWCILFVIANIANNKEH